MRKEGSKGSKTSKSSSPSGKPSSKQSSKKSSSRQAVGSRNKKEDSDSDQDLKYADDAFDEEEGKAEAK